MRQWMCFMQRGDANATREGVTLTEHQLKEEQVPRLQLLANVDNSGGLTALTASCARDSG
jgi:hypothetical protein